MAGVLGVAILLPVHVHVENREDELAKQERELVQRIAKEANYLDQTPSPTPKRDQTFAWREESWEIIADDLSTAGWSWGCVLALNSPGERSGSQTHIATTVSVSSAALFSTTACHRDYKRPWASGNLRCPPRLTRN